MAKKHATASRMRRLASAIAKQDRARIQKRKRALKAASREIRAADLVEQKRILAESTPPPTEVFEAEQRLFERAVASVACDLEELFD